MRVMFVGDSHASKHFMQRIFNRASASEVEVIVSVGDFGWWPRRDDGKSFIETVEKLGRATGIPLYFVDGNHEDHSSLPHALSFLTGPLLFPTQVRPGIFWIPRGGVFALGSQRLMGLGGAYSIDRAFRKEGSTWFRQEVVSGLDFTRAYRTLERWAPDIVVTHDGYRHADLVGLDWLPRPVEQAAVRESELISQFITDASPDYAISGHFHQRIQFEKDGTQHIRLAADIALVFEDTYVIMEL